MTTEQYYAQLPVKYQLQEVKHELNQYFYVSGFSYPQLNILKYNEIAPYEWGLIPFWVKDLDNANKIRKLTLNARGETAFEKPSFRSSIINQRCILPVSGFYEWKDVNGVKIPYFIYCTENTLFSIGAIYDKWVNENTGEIHNSFSIITTPANTLMGKIHNIKKRMPLIIGSANAEQWLDPKLKIQNVKELIVPYSDKFMKAYTISKSASNSKANRNVPEIQNYFNYDELLDSNKPNLLF